MAKKKKRRYMKREDVLFHKNMIEKEKNRKRDKTKTEMI